MAKTKMSYVNLLPIILCVYDRAAGQCYGVARQLSASVKESKDLTSPGYPRPYPSNSGCRWEIDAGGAEGIVRVYIHDVRFDEADSCTPSNSLTLIDGLNPDTVLARLCKREDIKDTYKSSGPYLQVLFDTGANTHGMSGFYLSYFAVVKNTNVTNSPAQDNDTKIQAILGVIGSATGLLVILSIVCACICRQKRNTQRGDSREERPNTHRMDDAQTAVREDNGNAAYVSSSEDNLPPNYSDLAIRIDGLADAENGVSLNPSVGDRAGIDIVGGGGGGGSHGGGSVAAGGGGGGAGGGGGGEGDGEGGGLSREESTVSTPPPVYDSSMIELFPPQTLLPTSSGDLEQAVAYESQCSVPPPTTGSPPPPLTPESPSVSPMRFA